MSDTVEITWEVDDGYAGPARPQCFDVDVEDFAGLDKGDVKDLLERYIDHEFLSSVAWSSDLDRWVEQIMAALAEREAQEGE